MALGSGKHIVKTTYLCCGVYLIIEAGYLGRGPLGSRSEQGQTRLCSTAMRTAALREPTPSLW